MRYKQAAKLKASGLTNTEIAAVMGISKAAVCNYIKRARDNDGQHYTIRFPVSEVGAFAGLPNRNAGPAHNMRKALEILAREPTLLSNLMDGA